MTKTGLLILLTLFMVPAWAQLDKNATLNEEALLEEELEPVVSPVVDNPIEVTIKEWPVPWKDSRPRDPDVAPNGVIWLVGQGGDYAARFDPASEEFTQKVLPPGTGPHNLIVDRDGALWIAGNRQAFIGKMNSVTGELTRYTMPDETARDPHTLVFSGRNEGLTVSRWIRRGIRGLHYWAPTDWRPLIPKQWN